MMTMEAELRALRDELSNRSSLTSNTSSQATLKEIKDQDCSLADSNDNGINNAINEATIDNNVVKKEENSSSIGSISAPEPASKDNNGCGGPSEAKKAKKEDTSEANADNENKNNNRTTT